MRIKTASPGCHPGEKNGLKKFLPRAGLSHKDSGGRLTQWLECHLHTVEVRGSNPRPPTTEKTQKRSPKTAKPSENFSEGFFCICQKSRVVVSRTRQALHQAAKAGLRRSTIFLNWTRGRFLAARPQTRISSDPDLIDDGSCRRAVLWSLGAHFRNDCIQLHGHIRHLGDAP